MLYYKTISSIKGKFMTITEEKILNGIKHFVKNTKNVGRVKLFKLLYFWDFIHFERYGKTITLYEYFTFPFGPVPQKRFDDIQDEKLPEYLDINISIIEDYTEDEDDGFKRFKIILKNKKIDYDCFSPNEKQVLEDVTYIFREATAKQMTEVTHLKNSPWHKTINEHGMYKSIDYFLAIDENTPFDQEEITERFNLQKELFADGRI